MKEVYQKPDFRFVALNMNSSSGACDFEIDSGWEQCEVEVIEDFAWVFTSSNNNCNYLPSGFSICQHNGGPGSSVFGS